MDIALMNVRITFQRNEVVSDKIGIRFVSISTETTFLNLLANSIVRTPIPGPISNIPDFSFSQQNSAILGQTLGFIIKFCPRDFVNLNPCFSKIDFIVFMLDRLYNTSHPLMSIFNLNFSIKLNHCPDI